MAEADQGGVQELIEYFDCVAVAKLLQLRCLVPASSPLSSASSIFLHSLLPLPNRLGVTPGNAVSTLKRPFTLNAVRTRRDKRGHACAAQIRNTPQLSAASLHGSTHDVTGDLRAAADNCGALREKQVETAPYTLSADALVA